MSKSINKSAGVQRFDNKGPLPEDVLKGLVGGRKGEEAAPVDGDRAAAMTAGAEVGHHGGGFVEVAKTGFVPAAPTESPKAQGGNGSPSGASDAGAGDLSPKAKDEIVKDFQNLHGVKLKAEEELSKKYWKGTVEKDLTGSDPATTTLKSTALDKEKAASDKAATTADEHRTTLLSTAEQANKDAASKQAGQQAQQTVKNAEQNVKTSFDNLLKAHQGVQKGDSVKGAQNLVNIAQDIHKTNTQTVKMAEENIQHAVKSGNPGDLQKARDAYMNALAAERESKNVLDGYKQNLLKAVGEKVQDKAKELNKADDVLKKARQDAGDDTRPRTNSLPAGSGAPAGEKAVNGRGGAATEGDVPKGHEVGKQVEKTLRDTDAAKKAADVAKKAEEKSKKTDEHVGNALKFGGKVISQALTEQAKNDAKGKGTYENTTGTEVTHGGAESMTMRLADGSTLTVNTLHQTTLTQGSESWDSEKGRGANKVWTPKAEAGVQIVHTSTDASGNKVVDKDKVYASAEWENKAGYSISADHIDAEASSKVIAHAEVSHSHMETIFGLQNTTTTSVAAHGEAGATAGFHVGYDGIKVDLKASAEATASATVTNDTKIGDVTATVGATAFAQAKAEATASGEVTFDPRTGAVKAKAGGGFELTAGVGADVNVGLMSDSGNGVGGTAHFKAGAIGVKFEPDLSIRDGKVDFKVSLGGYLGVGGTYDFQIKGDYNKAAENVNKMNGFLEKLNKTDNEALKFVANTNKVGIYVWSAISGFFS